MGLTIFGSGSDKKYNFSYTRLHEIRYLACLSDGFYGSFKDFMKMEENGESWKRFTKFYQLLHFTDSEGVLVKEFFLEGVDYKDSFKIGSSTKLLEELEHLKDWLARNPERIERTVSRKAVTGFWALYDLVYDEVKEQNGILVFT